MDFRILEYWNFLQNMPKKYIFFKMLMKRDREPLS